jgi:hypothetical protein
MGFLSNLCGSATAVEGKDPEKPFDLVKASFPGSLPYDELVSLVATALAKHGYGKSSLLATSLCCDEVNRSLEHAFGEVYGDNFSMGGLAGFPFGGATSFGAMAHHIPTDGSCLIVYGPHVGVDLEGVVGKVNRRGRDGGSGACCGSAAAAAGYVKKVTEGEISKADVPTDPLDAQQTWVGNLLLPHAARLSNADMEAAELPLALFDCQDDLMQRIVCAMCKEVAGDGKIALLGGIQINTPPSYKDYFLPKVFVLKSNTGATIVDLIPSLK